MSRMTRSTRRNNIAAIVEDESSDLSAEHSPPSPVKERAPLAAIDLNNVDDAVEPQAHPPVNEAPSTKRGKGRGKTKAGKKGKKAEELGARELDEDIHEAITSGKKHQVEVNQAVNDACTDLLKGSESESTPSVVPDPTPCPASKAVRATRKQLNKTGAKGTSRKTREKAQGVEEPEATQEVQALEEGQAKLQDSADESNQDSTEGTSSQVSIQEGGQMKANERKTPVEQLTVPEDMDGEQPVEESANARLEVTMVASPAHTAVSTERFPEYCEPRIEDSMQAIDELEDAIERIGEQIPKISRKPISKKTTADRNNSKEPAAGNMKNPTVKPQKKELVVRPKPAVKTVLRTSHVKRESGTSAIGRTKIEVQIEARTKSGVNITGKPASTRRSIQMSFPPPPPPAKSSKPPTRPTFQLPGEAIARKLKEKKEERERLKQMSDELEEKKQKERKAKIAHAAASSAPTVRATAASKARESLLAKDPIVTVKDLKADDHASKAPAPTDSRRVSSLTVPKRSSMAQANSVARRLPSTSSTSRASTSRVASISTADPSAGPHATKTTVTAADRTQQRQRAKEIVSRDRIEKEERERARHEKEEAARRARAEAAERGRLASREWAMRKQAQLLAQKEAAKVKVLQEQAVAVGAN